MTSRLYLQFQRGHAARREVPQMADTKTKAQTTTEPKVENEIAQAARTWTESLREAGKAVADTAIAMQDRNVHFTQSDARRTAFRDLGREATEAYISFLATPVRLARRTYESMRETAERGSSDTN